MKRKLSLNILVSTTFLTLLVSFTPPGHNGIVDDVLKYTNKFRKSKGLHALIMQEELNAIAQKHSEDMAKGRVGFGHGGYDKRYKQVSRMYKDFKSFGENVAYGVRTGKEAVTMWEHSSGHRRNLLGNYRYIGIGIASDRRGNIYYTQVFVN